MRSLSVFAVIGLAVALAGALAMPALAQAQQALKIVNVICANNKIDKVDPEKVEARLGDKIQWVLKTANCPQELAGGTFEIKFSQTSPFTEPITVPITASVPSPQLPPEVRTEAKETKNIGQHAYTIRLLDRNNKELSKKDGTTLVIGVTPTLTEWGLIALGVLLAGGMGYMLYRRRLALRPAAP